MIEPREMIMHRCHQRENGLTSTSSSSYILPSLALLLTVQLLVSVQIISPQSANSPPPSSSTMIARVPAAATTLLLGASSSLSLVSAQDGDWASNWTETRSLFGSSRFDRLDPRSTMRGSGNIDIGGGVAKFYGSPRLYVSHDDPSLGWEDTEITAYGKYVEKGTSKSYSGLTIVTRSNHDLYSTDGCSAFGYYARIYQSTGECAFQKEYFHGASGDPFYVGTVYSPSKRVDCFPDGLPLNSWVGMKFRVTTTGTSDVNLQLWLDKGDNGNWGNWELWHNYTDTPGDWSSTSSTTVPAECPQADGDTVTRPGNVSFLRTDGEDTTTEVHWRDVTMTNSVVRIAAASSSAYCRDAIIMALLSHGLVARCIMQNII